jgi:hypothetical protein
MAYTNNMPAAARRHLLAADLLAGGHRRDVAGYLYGIAAECAVKAMMLDAGLRPGPNRREDPFYMHFPFLQTALLDRIQGRMATPLSTFLKNGAFLSNWSTDMRYSKGDEVQEAWVVMWGDQAKHAVASIGT